MDVIIHCVSMTGIPNNTKHVEEDSEKPSKLHRFEKAEAKILKHNEEDRKENNATSTIVRIPETKINNVTPSVLFLGKYKKSAIIWQASTTTQWL